jgi:hypothetical protein
MLRKPLPCATTLSLYKHRVLLPSIVVPKLRCILSPSLFTFEDPATRLIATRLAAMNDDDGAADAMADHC